MADTNEEMDSRFDSVAVGRLQDFPGCSLALASLDPSRRQQSQTRHVQNTQRDCYPMPWRGGARAGSVESPRDQAKGLTHWDALRCLRQSRVRSILPCDLLLMRRSHSRVVAMTVCSQNSLYGRVTAPCYHALDPCVAGLIGQGREMAGTIDVRRQYPHGFLMSSGAQ
jgi:hypothetical protein